MSNVRNMNMPLVALPSYFLSVPPMPSMIESAAAHGILEPIIVKRIGPADYRIVSGKRRIQAARLAGLKYIPARVYDDDWSDEDIISLIMNEQRAANPLAELAAIESLLEDGLDEDTIRRATGMSKKKIAALMQLRNLIPEIRAAFEAGKIKVSVANQIAKLPDSQQKKLLRTLQKDGVLRTRDVIELKKTMKEEEVAVAKLPIDFGDKLSGARSAQECLRELRLSVESDAPPAFLRLVDQALAEVGNGHKRRK